MKENGPTRVFVDGVDVTNVGVGQKISQNTTDITLGKRRDATAKPVDATEQTAAYTQWSARRHETIVLNKPIGYVSGTPQFATQRGSWTSKIQFYDTGRIGHAYKPAIQLVHGESFYKSAGSDFANPSEGLVKRLLGKSKGKGLAPAGRLDINSSGEQLRAGEERGNGAQASTSRTRSPLTLTAHTRRTLLRSPCSLTQSPQACSC